jgi:hypothetical protein
MWFKQQIMNPQSMKRFLFCQLVLLCQLSVLAQTHTNKTIHIEPSMSFQNYEHFKRLTLNSPDSHAEYISNFEFQWGFYYELDVIETELESALSDGTQFEYSLNKIISKVKVADSTVFNLLIDPNRYYSEEDLNGGSDINLSLKEIDDSTYLYFEEVEILVPRHLKEKFNTIVAGGKSMLGTFIFIDDNRIKLVRL